MNLNKATTLASMLSLFLFFSFSIKGQVSVELSYVSGYCNKVRADVKEYVKPHKYSGADYSCPSGKLKLSEGEVKKPYYYQLQKFNKATGIFENEGKEKNEKRSNVEYRDLAYNETYRVQVITLAKDFSLPLFQTYGNDICNNPVVGFQVLPKNLATVSFTNPLEIERYNQFDNNDLSGILQSQANFGGNGSSFGQRRKYCRIDVQNTDISYDISNSFGADHWQINLTRTNLTGGWASGMWHDYETANNVGNINVFGEAWLDQNGSNSIWEGQYRVTMLAYQDCDNAPWAIHEDYFEIYPSGQGGCRINLNAKEKSVDVILYPNPTLSDFVEYYTKGEDMANIEYTISTLNGQLIETGLLRGDSGKIDVSKLNNGIYAIIFKSGEETISKRLTIIK